jgi:hypothetical protein
LLFNQIDFKNILLTNNENDKLSVNSEILIPEICFTKKSKYRSKQLPEAEVHSSDEMNKEEKIDCLLQCKSCKLTVHQNCYAGSLDESSIYGGGGVDGKSNWLCDKCIWKFTTNYNNKTNDPQCHLCLLRGGAMKQTDDRQKWVHITCCLCLDGITFKNANTRSQINIPFNILNKEKKKFQKCLYCNPFTRHQTVTPTGLTVKCNISTCKNRFHVTCGFFQGNCLFEQADWPNPIKILCHDHAEQYKRKKKIGEINHIPFEFGSHLYLNLNNKIQIAFIKNIEPQIFYEVDFGDGTFR